MPDDEKKPQQQPDPNAPKPKPQTTEPPDEGTFKKSWDGKETRKLAK